MIQRKLLKRPVEERKEEDTPDQIFLQSLHRRGRTRKP